MPPSLKKRSWHKGRKHTNHKRGYGHILELRGKRENINSQIATQRKEATIKALQVIEKGGTIRDADKVLLKEEKEINKLVREREKISKEIQTKTERKTIDKRQRIHRRDDILATLKVIRELEEEWGLANKNKIYSKLREQGMEDSEITEILEKLKRDGNIYEPRHDNFKIV